MKGKGDVASAFSAGLGLTYRYRDDGNQAACSHSNLNHVECAGHRGGARYPLQAPKDDSSTTRTC